MNFQFDSTVRCAAAIATAEEFALRELALQLLEQYPDYVRQAMKAIFEADANVRPVDEPKTLGQLLRAKLRMPNEYRVDEVMQMNLTQFKGVYPSAYQYVLNGEKVNAIKNLREATGFGLKEAKDCIDAVWAVAYVKGLIRKTW